jgi:ribosomal-protein-alanine N-acetyltransferase
MRGLIARFAAPLPPEARRCLAGDLIMRAPEPGDYKAWAALREASRAFLAPWEPTWPEDDLTPDAFRKRIARLGAELRADQTYPFFLFDTESGALMGGLTLSNVRRRAAMSATLGYWMGVNFAGKGVMSRAVPALCRHAFAHFGLERIEAACLPDNHASIRVLEKAGFQREGFARAYLAIAGRRQDHLLFALLKSDPVPARKSGL